MAIKSDITLAHGWFVHEAKVLNITVTDDAGEPVALTGLDLMWRLLREAGGTTYLTKETGGDGITVAGDDFSIASILIATTDYDSGEIAAGHFYHELWDMSSDHLLTYGDVVINAASDPVVV